MEKKFETIYLHIGLMKTGTSKIQHEIYSERKAFEMNYNLLYPSIEIDPRPFKSNHSIFIASLFSNAPWKLPVNMNNGFDKEKIKKLNEKIRFELKNKFAQTAAENLLISAENISYFNENELENVFNWLKSMTNNLVVICCLRHPLDALSSTCQQIVKTGRSLNKLLPVIDASYIRKTLNRINYYINKSQLKLYDFALAKEHENGLLGKFLEEIGIVPNTIVNDTKSKVNSSMSMEATILYSCLNHHIPKFVNNYRQANRSKMDLQFFNKNFLGQKFKTPEYVYKRVSEQYEEKERRWLYSNYDIELKSPVYDTTPVQIDNNTIEVIANITNFSSDWIHDQFIKEIGVLNNEAAIEESELYKVAIAVNSYLLDKDASPKN